MTLEQVKAARPALDYDGRYGADTGPWTTAMFIEGDLQGSVGRPAGRRGDQEREVAMRYSRGFRLQADAACICAA